MNWIKFIIYGIPTKLPKQEQETECVGYQTSFFITLRCKVCPIQHKYKNEVGCRDDTVPKTVDTRKHCKVGLRACNNLPQP